MSIAILAHAAATGTTGAIDTSGASLLVAVNSAGSAAAPTDSQGNTWTLVDSISGGSFGGTVAIYYVNNPSTSATHTFTATGSYGGVFVVAVSGTDTATPFDKSNKAAAAQPGSVTPASNGALLVNGVQYGVSGTMAVDQGFTIQDYIAAAGGVAYGGTLATLIQVSAAAVNPTTTVNGTTGTPANVIAVFNAASGGGGGGNPWYAYAQM